MGGIRETFGRITVESRRESFIVHTSYGLRDARRAAEKLMPGDHFRTVDGSPEPGGRPAVHRVSYIDTTTVHFQAGSIPRDDKFVVPCDADGNALDQEDDPVVTSLGVLWNEHPHPEFELRDLSDLIAALTELKTNPR